MSQHYHLNSWFSGASRSAKFLRFVASFSAGVGHCDSDALIPTALLWSNQPLWDPRVWYMKVGKNIHQSLASGHLSKITLEIQNCHEPSRFCRTCAKSCHQTDFDFRNSNLEVVVLLRLGFPIFQNVNPANYYLLTYFAKGLYIEI